MPTTKQLVEEAPQRRRRHTADDAFDLGKRRRRCTQRNYTTFLIVVVTACLFADQNLMAPNLSAIAKDFNFNAAEKDTKLGGEIALALFMVGGVASLLFGFLADTFDRRRLYCAAILLGEMGCALTIFVTEYWQLFVLRALTGVALGASLPLVFSMLGDLFPPSRRSHASALVGIAMQVGQLLGQFMSGAVGPALGWRWPFVIVAVPSSAVALLFLFTATDPVRGAQDGGGGGGGGGSNAHARRRRLGRALCKKIRVLCASRSNRLMFAQGIPGCVPWGIIGAYLNDYLVVNSGAPSVFAATVVCTLYSVGGLFGQALGGWLGQRLYNKRRRYVAYLMGASTIVGVLPLALLFNLPFSLPAMAPIALVGGCCATITGANVRAVLQNVNVPSSRGAVFAMFALTDDVGKAFGPFFISGLILALGRRTAFDASLVGWVLCGLLLLGLAWTMEADEDEARRRVTEGQRRRLVDDMSDESEDHHHGRDVVDLEMADLSAVAPGGGDSSGGTSPSSYSSAAESMVALSSSSSPPAARGHV